MNEMTQHSKTFKTNEQINNYKPFAICDTHLHLVYQDSLERTIQIYKNIMEHFHYERIVLQAMVKHRNIES